MQELSYVYLIEAPGTGRWKIGKANHIPSRLQELQCASPVSLELHSYIEVPREDALTVERALHSRFRRQRHHVEWFVFDERNVRRCLCVFARHARVPARRQLIIVLAVLLFAATYRGHWLQGSRNWDRKFRSTVADLNSLLYCTKNWVRVKLHVNVEYRMDLAKAYFTTKAHFTAK